MLLTILPDWFQTLLMPNEQPSILGQLIVLFGVISAGILIGKIRFRRITFGIAGVLFAGIFAGHYGYRLNPDIQSYLLDMGLILFVYALGLQVGPSFFSSFKQDGLLFNSLALLNVVLGVGITILLFHFSEAGMDNMVGLMSGAVTNTPGLGAAKTAILDLSKGASGVSYNNPANAYAIAYPFGVLGVILVLVLVKRFFKVNVANEIAEFESRVRKKYPSPDGIKCRVIKPDFVNKTVGDFIAACSGSIIISRLKRAGSPDIHIPGKETLIKERDVLMLVGLHDDLNKAIALLGRISTDHFIAVQTETEARNYFVTNKDAVRKSIQQLNMEDRFGARITLVFRGGMGFLAEPSVVLHFGDRVLVVAEVSGHEKISDFLGNSEKQMGEPNLLAIAVGVVLGAILGSLPILLPGLSAPLKLGSAAGPLLVALLISRYGGIRNIHSYMNTNAMQFMRDFGLCLFFAAVGINAGRTFYDTFMAYNGWLWVFYGALITAVPLIITLFVARKVFKLNFMPVVGILAGANTNPAALAFSSDYFKSDLQAQAYATVFPIATILRIIAAQALVLFFL